jgi:rod shape-determining protein MreC
VKRLFKNKIFLIALITIVLFVAMGITAKHTKLGWFSNAVNVVFSPVEKFFAGIGDKIGSGLSYFGDVKDLKDENKNLRTQIEKLQKDTADLERFKQENDNLRGELNLKNQLDEYDSIGGNIIAKDPGSWFNTFTIDVGSKDGVKNGYPVIANGGLIGSVVETGISSSKVISIIDMDSSVSGMLTKSLKTLRVKGDIALKDKGLCRIDYIEPDVDISVGDYIETSGEGGIFPKGILIGKIKEIPQTNNEFTRYAIIEPTVDFKKLHEVIVLKSKSGNEAQTGGAGQ